MKITSPWRRNNNTKTSQRSTPKQKIAWQQLGLKSRRAADPSMSIDEIRRQVIQASNQALTQDLESPSPGEGVRSSTGSKQAGPQPKAASRGSAAKESGGISAQRATLKRRDPSPRRRSSDNQEKQH